MHAAVGYLAKVLYFTETDAEVMKGNDITAARALTKHLMPFQKTHWQLTD